MLSLAAVRTCLVALSCIAAGCATTPRAPDSLTRLPETGAESARPRTVIMVGSEVDTLPTRIQQGGGTFGGEFNHLVNSPYTIQDPQGRVLANPAAVIPSQENGTWVVNPDGTMRTTWAIRPNALWHDGRSVTTADVELAFRVYTDPGALSDAGPDAVMTARVGSHGDAFGGEDFPLMVAWAFGR